MMFQRTIKADCDKHNLHKTMMLRVQQQQRPALNGKSSTMKDQYQYIRDAMVELGCDDYVQTLTPITEVHNGK